MGIRTPALDWSRHEEVFSDRMDTTVSSVVCLKKKGIIELSASSHMFRCCLEYGTWQCISNTVLVLVHVLLAWNAHKFSS